MFDLTMNMKNAFFDRPKVQSAVDKATRKAMSRSLAFVRTRQRSMLRRRKRTSQPGKPPSIRSTDRVATLKNILFAYDQRTKSGVVGMVGLNRRQTTNLGSMTVPQLMEFGGIVQQRSGRLLRSSPTRRRRRVQYRARPSAGPALDAEVKAGNIASPWANVIQG